MKVSLKPRKIKDGYSMWVVHSDGTEKVNGKTVAISETYRANIYLRSEDWDDKKKRLRQNSPRFRELNAQFNNTTSQIFAIIDGIKAQGAYPFPDRVRAEYEKRGQARDIASVYMAYIEGRKGITKPTKISYLRSCHYFKQYGKANFFDQLTRNFGIGFISFMIDEGLSESSANLYLSKFAKFIRDTFENGTHKNDTFRAWKIKFKYYKKPYLLPEERELWENGEAATPRQQAVKDIGIFLMEMNYRIGEAISLKPESNIEGIIHHKKNKVKKGEILVWRKPLTQKAALIWDKYGGVLPFDVLFVNTNRYATLNEEYKLYGEKIGLDRLVIDKGGNPKELYKMLSSHVFRHTFARKKWREEGYDPARISLAMGHSNPRSINSYLDQSDLDGFGVFEEKD